MVGPVFNQNFLGAYGAYANGTTNGNQNRGPLNGGQQPPELPADLKNSPLMSQVPPPGTLGAEGKVHYLLTELRTQSSSNAVASNPFGLNGTGQSTGFSSANFGDLRQQELRPNYSAGLPPSTSNGILNILA